MYRDYFYGIPRTVLISFPVAVVTYVSFLVINALLFVPNADHRREVMAESEKAHVLEQTTRPFLLDPTRAVEIWGHNECMILYMTVDNDPSAMARIISPRVPNNPNATCETLTAFMAGTEISSGYYHRYLHGFRVFTAALLAVVPLSAVPQILRAVLMGGIGLGCLWCLWQIRTRPETRWRQHGNLAIGVVFLLFWGLPLFGTSVSFAFGDAAVVALWLSGVAENPLRPSDRAWIVRLSVLGAFIAYVEFLTGQIPLALALLPGIVALGLDRPEQLATGRRRVGNGVAAFSTGVLSAAFLKQLSVLALFGLDGVLSFFSQLKRYTGVPAPIVFNDRELSALAGMGIDAAAVAASPLGSAQLLAMKFVFSSHVIGAGSRLLGTALLSAGVIILAVQMVRLLRGSSRLARARAELLLVSLLALAVWYGATVNHAIQHSFYMIRPMVWVIAAAVISVLISPRREAGGGQ